MKSLATVAQAFERPLPTGEKPEGGRSRAKEINAKRPRSRADATSCGRRCSPTPGPTSGHTSWPPPTRRAGPAWPAWRAGPKPGGDRPRSREVQEGDGGQGGHRVRRGDRDHPQLRPDAHAGRIHGHRPQGRRVRTGAAVRRPGEPAGPCVGRRERWILPQAAAGTTGGWNPEHQAWRTEGKVPLNAGKNTFAIEAHGLLPHIDKLAILPPEPRRGRRDQPAECRHARRGGAQAQADPRIRHRLGRLPAAGRNRTTRSSARGWRSPTCRTPGSRPRPLRSWRSSTANRRPD